MKFSLEIVAHDDKVIVSYPGDRTVVISDSSTGIVFSPAWNDRHFTWAADETTGAPFQHVTDETTDEQLAKEEYGSEDEYLYDMYSTMSGMGELKPANWVNTEHLWALDTDEYADALEEAGVMERSEDRVWIGLARLQQYIRHLTKNADELLAFLKRVFDPVDFEEAWDYDSRMFFTSDLESFVLQRPSGYVIEVPVANPVDVFGGMRSARAIGVMFQMFEDPKLPT